jgi:hypothetical protein
VHDQDASLHVAGLSLLGLNTYSVVQLYQTGGGGVDVADAVVCGQAQAAMMGRTHVVHMFAAVRCCQGQSRCIVVRCGFACVYVASVQ